MNCVFPLMIPMVEPSIRQQPGWIAYESLRGAVAAKFPTLGLTPFSL